jgi:hypothetical protein
MLKIAAISLLGLSSFSLGFAQKIPGCYIVSFKNTNNNVKGKGASGSSGLSAQALMAQASVKATARSFGKITAEYDRALNGFTVCGVKSESQLNSIRSNAHIASVEQDQVVKASAFRTVNALSWGLDRIDQRSPSLDGMYTYNDTAAPVNVYVLDTGILTTHTQFEGRAFPGYNFVNNNADSNDCNGHGTHCAGTVGSKDYGVCKHCRLIAVKVLDCGGSGTWSSVINGINWVINQAQSTGIPSVISMSLGGAYMAIVNDAVANAVSAGIVTVVAAGNENSDACGRSPASTPSAITVGAISKTNTRSSYSNFGRCLDIYAPGDDIVSTWIGSNTALNTISGTSMATPHVAGVAAIYRSYNPSKTAIQVRDDIVQSATVNVISGLDALSPNALLYSAIDSPRFPGNVVTIGGIVFGTTQFGYAFRPSNTANIVQIRDSTGKYASTSYPGGGWVGLAVIAASGSTFSLYWRNTINQQFAIWTLDSIGVGTNGVSVTFADLLEAEKVNNVDLDGDGRIGIQFIGTVVTAGQITFGTTQLGYAFKLSSSANILQITLGGQFVSASYPGGGWVGLGVVSVSGSSFALYWRNSAIQQFGRWSVDINGAGSNGVSVTFADLLEVEKVNNVDLDGDGRIGIQFIGTVVTSSQITFGTTQLGYAFKPSPAANIIQITYLGQYTSASYPGEGWIAAGVVGISSSSFEMYWRHPRLEVYLANGA